MAAGPSGLGAGARERRGQKLAGRGLGALVAGGLQAVASASPTGHPELCSRMNRWFADP